MSIFFGMKDWDWVLGVWDCELGIRPKDGLGVPHVEHTP